MRLNDEERTIMVEFEMDKAHPQTMTMKSRRGESFSQNKVQIQTNSSIFVALL